jgi:hypothetical protein
MESYVKLVKLVKLLALLLCLFSMGLVGMIMIILGAPKQDNKLLFPGVGLLLFNLFLLPFGLPCLEKCGTETPDEETGLSNDTKDPVKNKNETLETPDEETRLIDQAGNQNNVLKSYDGKENPGLQETDAQNSKGLNPL